MSSRLMVAKSDSAIALSQHYPANRDLGNTGFRFLSVALHRLPGNSRTAVGGPGQ
jgi:hypothetical protein